MRSGKAYRRLTGRTGGPFMKNHDDTANEKDTAIDLAIDFDDNERMNSEEHVLFEANRHLCCTNALPETETKT